MHVPVIPGAPRSTWPNQQLLGFAENYISHIYGILRTPTSPSVRGYAHWGWFTDSTLNASGRICDNSGLRRPSLADTCALETMLQQVETGNGVFAGGTTLNMFAVWSLWGDVQDRGSVCFAAYNGMLQHLVHPGRYPINERAADVDVNGEVNWSDYALLQKYLVFQNIDRGYIVLGVRG